MRRHKATTESGNFLQCCEQRCFACDKVFSVTQFHYEAITTDGQKICVGRNCYQAITASGPEGFQPPIGGPKLLL